MSVFSGLKVLDVGTWIAGPVAGTILADFGAEVIKVEMPGVGDAYRMLSSTAGLSGCGCQLHVADGRAQQALPLAQPEE